MYAKYRSYVRTLLGPRVLLEQLAEESCELGQAAMKQIRASRLNANSTPVTSDQAAEKLLEEAGDVLMMIDLLSLGNVDTSNNPKWQRWALRLGFPEVNE